MSTGIEDSSPPPPPPAQQPQAVPLMFPPPNFEPPSIGLLPPNGLVQEADLTPAKPLERLSTYFEEKQEFHADIFELTARKAGLKGLCYSLTCHWLSANANSQAVNWGDYATGEKFVAFQEYYQDSGRAFFSVVDDHPVFDAGYSSEADPKGVSIRATVKCSRGWKDNDESAPLSNLTDAELDNCDFGLALMRIYPKATLGTHVIGLKFDDETKKHEFVDQNCGWYKCKCEMTQSAFADTVFALYGHASTTDENLEKEQYVRYKLYQVTPLPPFHESTFPLDEIVRFAKEENPPPAQAINSGASGYKRTGRNRESTFAANAKSAFSKNP